MKGDFTRNTFQSAKHYQQVLMQQGRVQLDADWNEQSAVAAYRDQTTTADLVGSCGGPAHGAAFAILTTPSELASLPAHPASPVRQFGLSAGRYYVDGLQCEAERPFLFSWQPDHRESRPLPAGNYLIYLDVWRRHLTVHEVSEMREAALGGPDTGTRVKLVWQVRAAALDGPIDPTHPCSQSASEYAQRERAALPRLAARHEQASPETDPCTVSAGSGYRGLENQLYRVEIHQPGAMGEATFKWSRENAAVVTRITQHAVVSVGSEHANKLTVTSTGPDENLGFKPGNLVEIIHESEELEGLPGTLVLVDDVDDATGTVMLPDFGLDETPILVDLNSNPRLRRWEGADSVTAVPAVNDGYLKLEQGVEVKFEQPPGAEFRSGDYWQIPARTASADALSGRIEWPEIDILGNKAPEFLPPEGISHHYCRLGIVTVKSSTTATCISDCRCLWPALSEVPRLYYVSGDGQEVMPESTADDSTLFPLPRPLTVGVPNAHCHGQSRAVRFEVVSTEQHPSAGWVAAVGEVPTQSSVLVPLNADGLAECDFHLDGVNYSQQVEARRVDESHRPVSLPIRFNANLSRAAEVAYAPGRCTGLSNQITVQAAIDRLAEQLSMHKVSGDAQVGDAGSQLPQPLEVQVANRCGPVPGVRVQFTVRSGGGSVSPLRATTGAQGQAVFQWTLGNSPTTQELEASITGDSGPTASPERVRFTARVPSGESTQPGTRIQDIFFRTERPVPLRLGAVFSLEILQAGISIGLDRKIDPATVSDGGTFDGQAVRRGQPTCFVTVDVPVPLSPDETRLWGDKGLVGYTPIVLAADVAAEGNQIFWSVSPVAVDGLANVLGLLVEREGRFGERILARLTLKGNFIWSLSEANQAPLYLDGETFRLPRGGNANDIQLPSGDDRRGGDFEMWFWLIRSTN